MPMLRGNDWLRALLTVLVLAVAGVSCAMVDESGDPAALEDEESAGDPALDETADETAEEIETDSQVQTRSDEVWDQAVQGSYQDPEPIFSCGSRYCRDGGVWCKKCCNGSGNCWTTCGGCSGGTSCSGGQCRPN